jgi:O-acetyl-ADP-ribose deacetylase (regulator of RNase III)
VLKIVKGNVLEAKENLILHQVNENGVMGGGIAFQIAQKYPQVEQEYKQYTEDMKEYGLLGHFLISHISDTQSIVNCFTQLDFETQYEAIKELFKYLKHYAKENNLTLAIPYKYGCGIANGDWQEVEEILINIFDDYDITIYKYEPKNK